MTEKTGWARLRQDIAEEVARQIEKTSHTELTVRTDALAEKLAAVTLALVEADGALAQRVEKIERVVATMGTPGLGPDDTFRVARREFFPTEATDPASTKPRRSWWQRNIWPGA